MKQTVLEVTIKKRKLTYLATCKHFPLCKGVGKTKELALKKLSSSISSLISKMVNTTLDQVFETNNYTEIIFDQSKQVNEEHIAYNLSSDIMNLPKSFMFKVSSFSDESDELDELETEGILEDEISLTYEHSTKKSDEFEKLTSEEIYEPYLHHNKSNDSDSFVFGFPLNFN